MKIILAGSILLVLAGAIFLIITTHGFLWSVDSLTYKRYLESLPEPPSLIPETDIVIAVPYEQHGSRYFTMNEQYTQAISFFNTEVPKQEWVLINIDEDEEPYTSITDKYTLNTQFRFTNQSNYCLEIRVTADTNQAGNQISDEIYVAILIWDNIECKDEI